jgi:enamine deaminase RidA (YjgF/YER057c/UK114 family)
MEITTHRTRAPHIEARLMTRGPVAELYLTATPPPGDDGEEAVCRLYHDVRAQLIRHDARIFAERLFATADAAPAIAAIRSRVLGDLDDGVPPTSVVVSPGAYGNFAGVQVHAIRSPRPPEVVRCCDLVQGAASARQLSRNGHKWVYVSGLNAAGDIDDAEQARRMFFCAGCFLRQTGATMKSVARTWLWLRNICDWYDKLNATRRAFFLLEGLIDPVKRTTHLPASTGIGLYGANGAACTVDLIALVGLEDQIELVEAGGDQRSAFEYGSAFSRASVAPMPAGRTVFISGTAAIDPAGRTEHVGEIDAQVDGTIAHIRSLLKQLGCGDEHVLTSLCYCKTPAVEESFRRRWADLSWPRVTMVGDVCRPDLLFEIEVTASPDLKHNGRPRTQAKAGARRRLGDMIDVPVTA